MKARGRGRPPLDPSGEPRKDRYLCCTDVEFASVQTHLKALREPKLVEKQYTEVKYSNGNAEEWAE